MAIHRTLKLGLPFTLGLVALFVVACDGDASDDNTDGSGSAGCVDAADDGIPWQQYCADLVAQDEQCDPTNPPMPSRVECEQGEACFEATFCAHARAPLKECMRDRPCDWAAFNCLVEVGETMTPTATQQAFIVACEEKLAACPEGTFAPFLCFEGRLFSDSLVTQMMPCFDMACNAGIWGCLQGVTDEAAAPCEFHLGLEY